LRTNRLLRDKLGSRNLYNLFHRVRDTGNKQKVHGLDRFSKLETGADNRDNFNLL
jgi:hypothetical protein